MLLVKCYEANYEITRPNVQRTRMNLHKWRDLISIRFNANFSVSGHVSEEVGAEQSRAHQIGALVDLVASERHEQHAARAALRIHGAHGVDDALGARRLLPFERDAHRAARVHVVAAHEQMVLHVLVRSRSRSRSSIVGSGGLRRREEAHAEGERGCVDADPFGRLAVVLGRPEHLRPALERAIGVRLRAGESGHHRWEAGQLLSAREHVHCVLTCEKRRR